MHLNRIVVLAYICDCKGARIDAQGLMGVKIICIDLRVYLSPSVLDVSTVSSSICIVRVGGVWPMAGCITI